jgi:predicted transposase YdaD
MTAKPYDPTLKVLVETEPEVWPGLLACPTGPTAVIDADIATVSGAADKVLRVSAAPPYLLHLEFVAGHDTSTLPPKLHVRNGLLDDRHGLRVRSTVVLLQPEADSPQLTGVYQRAFPGEEPYLTFRYQVLRVWELPPEPLLTGGLPLLALAPISAVTEAELPGIIQRMERRLSDRHGRRQAPVVWGAAYILLGLRYSPDLAAQLFRGVLSMKESSTYQAILEEGRVEGRIEGRTEGAVIEARKVLRLQGDDAFGPADARTAAAIERLTDLAQLEELLRRVRTAGSWQELLSQPAPSRRGGRRRQAP